MCRSILFIGILIVQTQKDPIRFNFSLMSSKEDFIASDPAFNTHRSPTSTQLFHFFLDQLGIVIVAPRTVWNSTEWWIDELGGKNLHRNIKALKHKCIKI